MKKLYFTIRIPNELARSHPEIDLIVTSRFDSREIMVM